MPDARQRRGFTLVEIMIVVAIIVLLAALTFPGIVRSRMNANEASAIASLKTISWAAVTFRAANPRYPANLSELSTTDPPYVDTVLGSGTKQGYNFTLAGGTNTYNVTAQPVLSNVTGVRTFYVNEQGVLRGSSNGTADANSTPVQ